jgi:raffinose/stachyose/melibiose transport system substrate-binding protein
VTAVAAVLAVTVAGCSSTGSSTSSPSNVDPTGPITPRAISWLLSRPADGSVITTMKKIADEYAASHPGFSLNLITTPDRPSYIQKYETLAAANQLPDLFDTDATPFAQKLAQQGRMIDVDKLLKDLGLYDSYRPNALNYQRFDDGSLYMVPMQFELEFFWYNKALFQEAGVSVPQSLDDLPAMCAKLRAVGITPIAIDGQDQWPLERYVSYQPFRTAGPSYVQNLKSAHAKFADAPGEKMAGWLQQLGTNKCFEDGFASEGYADAQNLFTSGKAAIYNIGTWELSSLATDKLPAAMGNNIDFFRLPAASGSATASNEYVATSGIGMAVNAKTFDPLVKDFLKFALTKYPTYYAATGALSPTTNALTTVPANATPLYQKALDQAKDLGQAICFPWDTQLDPTTNTMLQQEQTLLAQGNITADQFVSTMDNTLAQNAPKYFS